jgi:hypothetical protein
MQATARMTSVVSSTPPSRLSHDSVRSAKNEVIRPPQMSTTQQRRFSVAVTFLLLSISLAPPISFIVLNRPLDPSEAPLIYGVLLYAACIGAFCAWKSPRDDVRAGLLGCISPIVAATSVVLFGILYDTFYRHTSLESALCGAVLMLFGVIILSLPALAVFRLLYMIRRRNGENEHRTHS